MCASARVSDAPEITHCEAAGSALRATHVKGLPGSCRPRSARLMRKREEDSALNSTVYSPFEWSVSFVRMRTPAARICTLKESPPSLRRSP
jgi:hypothetical protein